MTHRYPIKEACSSDQFLKILVKHGVFITLSSDAHYPNDIGKYVEECIEKLRKLGRNEIVVIDKRKKSFLSIEEMDEGSAKKLVCSVVG